MEKLVKTVYDEILENCKIESGRSKINANAFRALEELHRRTEDSITIAWSVDDVLHQAKQDKVELTKEQAREILDILKHKHDSNEGINWTIISTVISLYTGNMYVNQEKY